MQWRRVTIFISSTFNDMHAERDYLVKDVFPEVREWCEERKIHLVDIDLRWGVTEADTNSKHTVLACLNNIDESRPFFLCFLGQRRGWVPKKGEVSSETLNEYPDVSEHIGRSSITEMEIEHALLSPMKHIVEKKGKSVKREKEEKQEMPVDHALFYFRNPNYLNDLTPAQRKIFTNEAEVDVDLANRELEDYKEKIKNKWELTVNYTCNWDMNILSPELTENVYQGRLTDFTVNGKPLKDIIIEQLKEEIIKEFPNRIKVEYASDFERDLDQQALFIELNSEGFISREGDFDDLNAYITNEMNGLFVLSAPAGFGKSMLLANFIKRESKNHKARFFNRFCGVSDLCSQSYTLWKTIFREADVSSLKIAKEINELKRLELTENENNLKINKIKFQYDLENWLPDKNALQKNIKEIFELLSEKEKTTIIIDAINQLPDCLEMLDWLPKQLPDNLKIIISIKKEENDKEISKYIEKLQKIDNICYSSVKPFKEKDEKKKLINEYLKKYLKALDDKQIDTICDFEGSKNPLYLKILLSELRIFGSFSQISKKIQQFGVKPKEAFDTLLKRMETEVNSLNIDSKIFTPLLFGLLANARDGLSEEELVACLQKELEIDREKLIYGIRLFIRQVRPFMARREGRLDYFYESFKLAVKEKYLNEKIYYNKILADHFQEQVDPEYNLSYKGKIIRDFNELPYHLKESDNSSCLQKMLSTYLWIKNRTELSNIQITIKDYDNIDVENEAYIHVKLIKDALVLSSHTLQEKQVRDSLGSFGTLKTNIKDNLPTQMWRRLKDIENPKIKDLLIEIDKYTDYPWLKPYCHIPLPKEAIMNKNSVCFSPDGKYVAFAYHNCVTYNACIWDWEKQEEIWKSKKHFNTFCVCFFPNGKYYVSVDNKAVCVWDWKKQKRIKKLKHKSVIKSLCVSPDGKYIVSVTDGKIVHIWDWEKQEEIQVYEVLYSHPFYYRNFISHHLSVDSVCFSPDGKYIAIGIIGSFSDGNHRFFDYDISNVLVLDWKFQKEISKLEKYIGSMFFSPDRKIIASGSWNDNGYCIRVWDWEKEKEKTQLLGCVFKVNSLCFSPDGKYVVSGVSDYTIRVWEILKESTHPIISINTEGTNSCVFSNVKPQIAIEETNGLVIYNFENLPAGKTIVTALRDFNNKLRVRCNFCGKNFDIPEEKLDNIVFCFHCEKELQVSNFTTDDYTHIKKLFSRRLKKKNTVTLPKKGAKCIYTGKKYGWTILEESDRSGWGIDDFAQSVPPVPE